MIDTYSNILKKPSVVPGTVNRQQKTFKSLSGVNQYLSGLNEQAKPLGENQVLELIDAHTFLKNRTGVARISATYGTAKQVLDEIVQKNTDNHYFSPFVEEFKL